MAQLDAAQAELEAGNAALLQGAPFLVEMLALQAAAPGTGPVSALNPQSFPAKASRSTQEPCALIKHQASCSSCKAFLLPKADLARSARCKLIPMLRCT